MFLFGQERTDSSLSVSSFHFLIDIVCVKEAAEPLCCVMQICLGPAFCIRRSLIDYLK